MFELDVGREGVDSHPFFAPARRKGLTMAERTKYQEKIIKNFYQNRDTLALQRAQEIVTELYLSSGKKREKQWQLLVGHLAKLGVHQNTIDHLVAQDAPQKVATLINSLLAKS
jgi:hypothetical protein